MRATRAHATALVLAATVAFGASGVRANAAPADALGAFAGAWRLTGTLGTGASAKPVALDEDCSWSGRRAYLVCEQWKPDGPPRSAGVTLFFYDSAAKTYRFVGFGSDGDPGTGVIEIAGPLWTFASGGRSVRFRTTNRWSPDGRTVVYRSQRSTDGGRHWIDTGRGVERRTGG